MMVHIELHKCPECGANISERLYRCPHCECYLTRSHEGSNWYYVSLGRCVYHPQVKAVTRCPDCQKPICQECAESGTWNNKDYCPQCYNKKKKKASWRKFFCWTAVIVIAGIFIVAFGHEVPTKGGRWVEVERKEGRQTAEAWIPYEDYSNAQWEVIVGRQYGIITLIIGGICLYGALKKW